MEAGILMGAFIGKFLVYGLLIYIVYRTIKAIVKGSTWLVKKIINKEK